MKTTLEIPDDLFRQAEERAAQDHREIEDLVSDGLKLVLGAVTKDVSRTRALAALDKVRRDPPYPPGKVQSMIDEANRLRKESWE